MMTTDSSVKSADTAAATTAFVGGKQKDLGVVDQAAASPKSGSPERFVPKKTLADGSIPKKGKRVVLRPGDAAAKIVETFQVAAQVLLEAEGTVKTVAYSQMSTLRVAK